MSELDRKDIIRESDGFINATVLCKVGGKKFGHWNFLESTKELIQCLSLKLNIPIEQLKDVKRGGNHSGSWIHPRLGLCLAQWLSVKFMLEVSEWIDEWKNISEINSKKYIFSLENIEPDNDKSCVEKDIQIRLHKELGGEMEVHTNFGYIDLLTETELIEIKVGNNWKHGLGQLLAYRKFYLNHKLRLHLFGIEEQNDISDWCKEYNVSVTYDFSNTEEKNIEEYNNQIKGDFETE